VGIWDERGSPVEEQSIRSVPLYWAHHNEKELTLGDDAYDRGELTLFYTPDSTLCLYQLESGKHKPINLQRESDVGLAKLRVRVRVFGDNRQREERDYWIEWDSKCGAGYRPCDPPESAGGEA
jgi:hypothetical protein